MSLFFGSLTSQPASANVGSDVRDLGSPPPLQPPSVTRPGVATTWTPEGIDVHDGAALPPSASPASIPVQHAEHATASAV